MKWCAHCGQRFGEQDKVCPDCSNAVSMTLDEWIKLLSYLTKKFIEGK